MIVLNKTIVSSVCDFSIRVTLISKIYSILQFLASLTHCSLVDFTTLIYWKSPFAS